MPSSGLVCCPRPAALYGVLTKIRNLNLTLTLINVREVSADEDEGRKKP
jgi:hypothetical protein